MALQAKSSSNCRQKPRGGHWIQNKITFILLQSLEVPTLNSRNSLLLCVWVLLNCDVGAMSRWLTLCWCSRCPSMLAFISPNYSTHLTLLHVGARPSTTLTCATETIVHWLQNPSPAQRKLSRASPAHSHHGTCAALNVEPKKPSRLAPRPASRPPAVSRSFKLTHAAASCPCFHTAPPDGRRTLSVLSLDSLLV